ncbi:65-kDa microtubule-associated protein 1 [Camellia lanceoleosa]|uniref:65-kDa microtubule-associated protein 1 n=1 Tax=Camellia lanceoleosa TaxID=1840588 RepID=A0ACC0I157_9ERIC|nr:65-kDa microtubule-associated protein 1 [Camellia lanceoleosa]
MLQAEVEVERLDQLKASRMKEIALKKQTELEEIFAHAHSEVDSEAAREKIKALIDSGNVDHSKLLADMDNQIIKTKEEALSRKEILDKSSPKDKRKGVPVASNASANATTSLGVNFATVPKPMYATEAGFCLSSHGMQPYSPDYDDVRFEGLKGLTLRNLENLDLRSLLISGSISSTELITTAVD